MVLGREFSKAWTLNNQAQQTHTTYQGKKGFLVPIFNIGTDVGELIYYLQIRPMKRNITRFVFKEGNINIQDFDLLNRNMHTVSLLINL